MEYIDYRELHRDTINKLHQMVNSGKITVETACSICADFVPESIKEDIITYLSTVEDKELIPYETWIAWLEKQGEHKPTIETKTPEESLGIDSDTYNKIVDECIYGEQKPTDKVEPKFREGDWVVLSTSDGEKVVQVDFIEYFKSGEPIYVTSEDRWFDNRTKAHLWTIQDAKDGDVLVNWNNTIYLFKGIEEEVVKFYCYYNTNREEFNTPLDNNSHLGLTEPQFEHHPATKEQRNSLFQKIHEAGYTWDAEKKELKKEKVDNLHNYLYGEQKPVEDIKDIAKHFFELGLKVNQDVDLELVVGWFDHIAQIADDRKTANGVVMEDWAALDEIKCLAKESSEFIKTHYKAQKGK